MKYVLGQKSPQRRVFDEELDDESEGRGSVNIAPPKPDFASRKAEAAVVSASSDEDDALSYFQKLAEE